MTCLGTDTSFTPARGDKEGLGAGRLVGTMSGVSIQKDGIIVAYYDNGDSKIIAQIAVANFKNLSGLEKSEIIFLRRHLTPVTLTVLVMI